MSLGCLCQLCLPLQMMCSIYVWLKTVHHSEQSRTSVNNEKTEKRLENQKLSVASKWLIYSSLCHKTHPLGKGQNCVLKLDSSGYNLNKYSDISKGKWAIHCICQLLNRAVKSHSARSQMQHPSLIWQWLPSIVCDKKPIWNKDKILTVAGGDHCLLWPQH